MVKCINYSVKLHEEKCIYIKLYCAKVQHENIFTIVPEFVGGNSLALTVASRAHSRARSLWHVALVPTGPSTARDTCQSVPARQPSLRVALAGLQKPQPRPQEGSLIRNPLGSYALQDATEPSEYTSSTLTLLQLM